MECWQEVMIDLEGPSPPDKNGNRYNMTYMRYLCHGVLVAMISADARRALAIARYVAGVPASLSFAPCISLWSSMAMG